MSSYCQISDVLYPFPRFQRALPNNLSDAAIQAWVDEGKAEIRARFLRRSIDPDNPSSLGWNPPLSALTTDQSNVLRKFNVAYVIIQFGDAALAQMSDNELALVKKAQKIWDGMVGDTDGHGGPGKYLLGSNGAYDALFTPNATHIAIGPQFSGFAGADFDPRYINNYTTGTHFMFEKAQKF